jgi:hypothetical protein
VLELQSEKGPNMSGVDPETDRVVALFNQGKERWEDHFAPAIGALKPPGIVIQGLTKLLVVRCLGEPATSLGII